MNNESSHPSPNTALFGALVISLDFELHWGVRDSYTPDSPYRQNLLGARRAIPLLLNLFTNYNIAATWATVGLLFARSREETHAYRPPVLPSYTNTWLLPYNETIGTNEHDDPLHFAPSLIAAIARCPGQELASHTFSHYYCLEPKQNKAAFEADIASAVAIAREHGYEMRSIVFPRNQYSPAYDDILLRYGLTTYRGNESGWMYQASTTAQAEQPHVFSARWLDRYFNMSGFNLHDWDDVVQLNGLCNVAASRFLRPYAPRWKHLEPLFIRRIVQSIRAAAIEKKIFHLWWHPHNFGAYTTENMARLGVILAAFDECRRRYGMQSPSMSDVAGIARHQVYHQTLVSV